MSKPQKVITLEDVDSSTTIALSPIVHKQQPQTKDIHSHVEDLYPPPVNTHSSISTSLTTDDSNHKVVKVLLEPSFPRTQQKPPEASTVPSAQVWPPVPSVVSVNSSAHHDVDNFTSPEEGRTADAVCISKEATTDKLKQQNLIPSKRRKKRVKTTAPKPVHENSSSDKLELKRPVSDDICNWLQLEDSESKQVDERLQYAWRSHDQSHELQVVISNSDSQDTEQSIHCQITPNNTTKQCRLSPQRNATLDTQAPSSIMQQQRPSDSGKASSIQSTTCKH